MLAPDPMGHPCRGSYPASHAPAQPSDAGKAWCWQGMSARKREYPDVSGLHQPGIAFLTRSDRLRVRWRFFGTNKHLRPWEEHCQLPRTDGKTTPPELTSSFEEAAIEPRRCFLRGEAYVLSTPSCNPSSTNPFQVVPCQYIANLHLAQTHV